MAEEQYDCLQLGGSRALTNTLGTSEQASGKRMAIDGEK
jgi:hypothetical protein